MQRYDTQGYGEGFKVLGGTKRSQAALMTLSPGEKTGGPDNRHDTSDQWLFIVSGTGNATVAGRDVELAPGSLLCIEANEPHEIRAGTDEPLVTLSVYAPPAY